MKQEINESIISKRNSIFPQLYLGMIFSAFIIYSGRIQNLVIKGALLGLVWATVLLLSLRKIRVFNSYIESNISLIGYRKTLNLDEKTFLQVRGFVRCFSGIQFIFKRAGYTMKFVLSHDDAKKVLEICLHKKVKVNFGNGSKHLI